MKRTYTTILRVLSVPLILIISVATLIAQTPGTFNYQAVVRDAEGNPRTGAGVSMEFEIHQSTPTGTVVYYEIQNTTTNDFGMVNLEMGSVHPGDFEVIDWSAGPYYVEVSVDGISMGTSQFLTVPYALHANTVENVEITGSEDVFDDWDKDAADDVTGETNIQHYFQFVTFHSSSAQPIAFGFINADGTIESGSGNFTCVWDEGRYAITITGHSYFWTSYTTVVTLAQGSGSPAIVSTDSVSGSLLVYFKR